MKTLILIVPLIVVLLQSGGTLGKPHSSTHHDNRAFFSVANPETGKTYDVKLTRADKNVLHPNIKVYSARGGVNGKLILDAWTPSQNQIETAEDIYVDMESLAAVRFSKETNFAKMEGVVDGQKLEVDGNGNMLLVGDDSLGESDYVDLGVNLTFSGQPSDEIEKATVEILVICDMEWGRKFNFGHQRVLEYFAVYFSDISLRFKTLPSVDISFQITGIVVVEDPSGQPFIEDARQPDGRIKLSGVLGGISRWTRDQKEALPNFDVTIVLTNTPAMDAAGMAYVGGACQITGGEKRHLGVVVVSDGGSWRSADTGSHEIAHNLGAPHDQEIEGCTDRGYIMSGPPGAKKWYFSTCSNTRIANYIKSNNGNCLRRQDELSDPPINVDLGYTLGVTVEDQCRQRLNQPSAFVPDKEDRSNCSIFICAYNDPVSGKYEERKLEYAIDNTICKDNGRCFRGRCRSPASLIQNVGSGKCIINPDRFSSGANLEIGDCNLPGTALDRLSISDTEHGKIMGIPWQSVDAEENGEKCIHAGSDEASPLYFQTCDANNNRLGWDFIDAGNGEILIASVSTKLCAKETNGLVHGFANCDRNDPNMRWKLL